MGGQLDELIQPSESIHPSESIEPSGPGSHFEDMSSRIFALNAGLMHAIGFTGVEDYRPQERCISLGFEVRAEFCHSGGRIAQGGFVTAWLDAAMAHAVFVESGARENLASLEIKVSFLAPVGPGKVIARSRIIRKGKRVAFLEASLFDAKGMHLASATSTAMITSMAAQQGSSEVSPVVLA